MMNRSMKFSILLFILLFNLHFIFAGGDGFMGYDWHYIKKINAGPNFCKIVYLENPDFYPETSAYFNKNGKIIKFKEGAGLIEFKYDDNGNMTEAVYSYPDEKGNYIISGKTVYSYDNNGFLNKISDLDDSNKVISSDGEFSVDKNGNIKIRYIYETEVTEEFLTKDLLTLERIYYVIDDKTKGTPIMFSKESFTYDNYGNLTERTITNMKIGNDNPPFPKVNVKYLYQYDKSGNKISQSTKIEPAEAAMYYTYMDIPQIKFEYSNQNVEAPKKDETKNVINMKVLVEWQGAWYPAVILKQEGEKYFIHYVDYDSSWDEWVTKDRIKF